MSASYPTSVHVYTTKVDGPAQYISASHINDLQAEVAAIEDGLINGLGHVLKVSTFGTHVVSAGGTGGNILQVRNTTTGTSNYSAVGLGNDASEYVLTLYAYSSTHSSYPSYGEITASGSGGLTVAAGHASGVVRICAGGSTPRLTVAATGALTITTPPAFAAGDKYLVVDVSGNIHVSALGPAS